MKQTLLFIFCVIAFITIHAQNVRITDSTYSSNDSGVTLHLSSTRQLRYNEDCNNDADDNLTYDVQTGNITERGYDTIEFDNSKLGTRYTYQSFNSTTSLYENVRRTTFTYDSFNSITSQLNQVWINDGWHNQYFDSIVRDANNDQTFTLFKVWNEYADTLLYAYRNTLVYDSARRLLTNNQETYNYLPGLWTPVGQTTNTYDANGYLVKTTNESWNLATSSWFLNNTSDYYNNSKGLIDSTIIMHAIGGDTQKWYYTYDGNTSRVAQSKNYLFSGNQLITGRRYTYYYAENNSEYFDSTLAENIDLSKADSFVLYTVNIYHEYRNDDGSIHDYIYHFNNIPANYDSYNRTYFTYGPCMSVLPVSLVSFTGTQKNNNAQLQWQTTNEVNTSTFTVWRSTDGIHFSSIGSTSASGNSTSIKNYAYTDVNISSLNAPRVYYKLAIADKNGTITFSKVVQLDIVANQLHVFLSPNPVANTLSVYSPVSILGAVIKINDLGGKTLYTSRQNLSAGSKLTIDVSAFAKGMYIVTVQSAGNKFEYKMVRQ